MASKEEELAAEYAASEEYEPAEGSEPAVAEGDDVHDEEKELEEMKKRVQEMEEEARKLQEMQDSIGGDSASKEEIDARSVFVGNVDFAATAEELQQHFKSCGTINRITILTDKWTGHPKGFAYIEFVDITSVANALELNDSQFRGRPLKVSSKRTNLPSFAIRGAPRGGRGGFRGFRGGPPRGRGGGRWRPPRGRYYGSPY